MNTDSLGFFLQTDPALNEREAWTAREFPQAHYHYFKDSGCVVTSLWNMCCCFRVPGFSDDFPTPWELNEVLKAAGAFYPTANIELALLDKVVPVRYRDRFGFDTRALEEQLGSGVMCLLRAKGENGPYHYVLPLREPDGSASLCEPDGGAQCFDPKVGFAGSGGVQCFDPKVGITRLSAYEEIYQIIRFQRLW